MKQIATKDIAQIQRIINVTNERLSSWYENAKNDYAVDGSAVCNFKDGLFIIDCVENSDKARWRFPYFPQESDNYYFDLWAAGGGRVGGRAAINYLTMSNGAKKMSNYQARISKQGNSFYALVVRIDRDGQESVVNGFVKFYKTLKSAEKGTAFFINKYCK